MKKKIKYLLLLILVVSTTYYFYNKKIGDRFESNQLIHQVASSASNVEYYKDLYKKYPDLYAYEYGTYCLSSKAETLLGADYEKLCTSCFSGSGSIKEQYKYNPKANEAKLKGCCSEPRAKEEMGEIVYNRLCSVDVCEDDSLAVSCTEAGSEGYIYEAKEKGITKDNYKCLIAAKSKFDNKSYELPLFSENTYCSVYCKEDAEYLYPGHGYNPSTGHSINSGGYFIFKPIYKEPDLYSNLPTITQTKSCIYKTDNKRFLKDLYGTDTIPKTITGGYYKEAENRLEEIQFALNQVISLEYQKTQLMKKSCVVADSTQNQNYISVNNNKFLASANLGNIALVSNNVRIKGPTEEDYKKFLEEFDDTQNNKSYEGPYITNCPMGSKNDRDVIAPDGHFRPAECCEKLTTFYVIKKEVVKGPFSNILPIQKKYYESANPGWSFTDNRNVSGTGIAYYKLSAYNLKNGYFELNYKKRDCIKCTYDQGWQETSSSGQEILIASATRVPARLQSSCNGVKKQNEKEIEYHYQFVKNGEVFCKVMKLTRDCSSKYKNTPSTIEANQYHRPVKLELGWKGPTIDTTKFDYYDYVVADETEDLSAVAEEPSREPESSTPWVTSGKAEDPQIKPSVPGGSNKPNPSKPNPNPPKEEPKPQPPKKENNYSNPCPPSHPNYPCHSCDYSVNTAIYELDVEINQLKKYIREVVSEYLRISKQINNAQNEYQSCFNYNNQYLEIDAPKVENFYYDEMDQPNNQKQLLNKIELINKNETPSKQSPYKFCKETKDGYDCTGINYQSVILPSLSLELKEYTDDLNEFVNRHKTNTLEMYFYDYAENSVTTQVEYGFNLELYSLKPTGLVVTKEQLRSGGAYNYLGFSLPISLITPGNTYKYSFDLTNLGANNSLLERYKSLQNGSKYTCLYAVDNSLICPNAGCEVNNCTSSLDCITSDLAVMKNPEFMAFVRTVSNLGINPNDRILGSNWSDAKGIAASEKIINDGEAIYEEEPLYSFTLNNSNVREIKKYNKENEYYDFNLTCDYSGNNCESSFINKYDSSNNLINSRSRWLLYDEETNKYIYTNTLATTE